MRHYMYFDLPGIQRLLGQIEKYQEREIEIHTLEASKESNKKATNPHISANILAAGFKLVGINENNLENNITHELKKCIFEPDEKKLEKIEKYLPENDKYFELNDICDAQNISLDELPAFCKLSNLTFKLAGNYGLKTIDTIRNEQFVLMQTPPEDEYEGGVKIFVGAGLSKFDNARYIQEKDIYDFGDTSHMSIFLHSLAAQGAKLGVFGHVRELNRNMHIKPYAIWF